MILVYLVVDDRTIAKSLPYGQQDEVYCKRYIPDAAGCDGILQSGMDDWAVETWDHFVKLLKDMEVLLK
jgi:hypothetical protein